jgi:hypothetical protein
MANLVMDGVTLASKSGGVVTIQNTNVNLDANITGNATFPAGHVLQVVDHRFTDQFSLTSSSGLVVIGNDPYMEKVIVRSSTSNKVLVHVHINAGTQNHGFFQLQRKIGSGSYGAVLNGVANSSRPASFGTPEARSTNASTNIGMSGLDSPGGLNVSVTYRVMVQAHSSSNGISINQTENDGDGPYGSRMVSSITLMEIQG